MPAAIDVLEPAFRDAGWTTERRDGDGFFQGKRDDGAHRMILDYSQETGWISLAIATTSEPVRFVDVGLRPGDHAAAAVAETVVAHQTSVGLHSLVPLLRALRRAAGNLVWMEMLVPGPEVDEADLAALEGGADAEAVFRRALDRG